MMYRCGNLRTPVPSGHGSEPRASASGIEKRGYAIFCCLTLAVLSPFFLSAATPEAQLRAALEAKTGAVTLPVGTIEISREIVLPADAHDLDLRGSTTIIKAAATFRGRALVVIPAGKNIKLHDLSLDGNRDAVARPLGLAPSETMFSRFM